MLFFRHTEVGYFQLTWLSRKWQILNPFYSLKIKECTALVASVDMTISFQAGI